MCVACALIPAVISVPFGLFGIFSGGGIMGVSWGGIALFFFGISVLLFIFFQDKIFAGKKEIEEKKEKQ
jgi:hypothetical protein